jgi:hypothetical protein
MAVWQRGPNDGLVSKAIPTGMFCGALGCILFGATSLLVSVLSGAGWEEGDKGAQAGACSNTEGCNHSSSRDWRCKADQGLLPVSRASPPGYGRGTCIRRPL